MAGTAEALELLLFARRSVFDDLRLVPAVAGARLSFGLPRLRVGPDELRATLRDVHQAAPEYAEAVAVEDQGLPALDVLDHHEPTHLTFEVADELVGLADLEPLQACLLADREAGQVEDERGGCGDESESRQGVERLGILLGHRSHPSHPDGGGGEQEEREDRNHEITSRLHCSTSFFLNR